MDRLVPPSPDRAYLESIHSIEYAIQQISKALRLGTDDPDPNGFRVALPYARHLYELTRIAAIAQERKIY